jgi:hypothetical protein
VEVIVTAHKKNPAYDKRQLLALLAPAEAALVFKKLDNIAEGVARIPITFTIHTSTHQQLLFGSFRLLSLYLGTHFC